MEFVENKFPVENTYFLKKLEFRLNSSKNSKKKSTNFVEKSFPWNSWKTSFLVEFGLLLVD